MRKGVGGRNWEKGQPGEGGRKPRGTPMCGMCCPETTEGVGDDGQVCILG